MAEFDAFEQPAEQTGQEEDPAAAFLAREQDDLKGLEDDNAAQQTQGGDFDPFGGDQASGSPQQADFFGGGEQDGMAEIEQDDMGGDANFGLGDFGGAPTTSSSGLLDFDAEPEPTQNGPTDSYAAISQVDRQRQEPEKIRIWREMNTKRIAEKDEEEAQRKEEWREIAKKELDDWYKHHDEQLNKTKENNRAAEEAFVAERDQNQPGEEWEKICRLCEFNPKNSKNTKDISRMRSILLQLKQTPLVR